MKGTTFELILDAMTAIGTFAAGIAAIYGVIRVLKNMRFKNEILYGEEAEIRLKEIRDKLPTNPDDIIAPIKFTGGSSTIIPRLEIERCNYDKETMGNNWKGCKKLVRHVFYDEKSGENKVEIWRIK